jgi:hypothetical protein
MINMRKSKIPSLRERTKGVHLNQISLQHRHMIKSEAGRYFNSSAEFMLDQRRQSFRNYNLPSLRDVLKEFIAVNNAERVQVSPCYTIRPKVSEKKLTQFQRKDQMSPSEFI